MPLAGSVPKLLFCNQKFCSQKCLILQDGLRPYQNVWDIILQTARQWSFWQPRIARIYPDKTIYAFLVICG